MSATVSVVCSVLTEPTAPTRRMSPNSGQRSRVRRGPHEAAARRTGTRRARRWSARVVRTTATPAPAMPSAGIGPKPKMSSGDSGTSSDHPDADGERRHQHVAGAADHARQGVHQPDQHVPANTTFE